MRGWAWILMIAVVAATACESSSGANDADVVTPDVPSDPGTDTATDPGTDPGREDVDTDVPFDGAQDEPADLPVDVPADASTDVPPVPGPCGFMIRVPQTLTIPFEMMPGDPPSTQDMPQTDHVCTFKYDTKEGCFYVQASPVEWIGWAGPTYRTDGFWTSFDDVVAPVADSTYSWGGNHHNDSVTFPLDGSSFRAYHSTMGFGGRSCQPMDCLQVYAADGTTLVQDGCDGLTRTLPIACVIVNADGTVPDFPTTFERCVGDPNLPP